MNFKWLNKDILNVKCLIFLFPLAFAVCSFFTLKPSLLHPSLMCPLNHLVLPFPLFSNCSCSHGHGGRRGKRLHRICCYVIHYLAPSWLAHLEGAGVGVWGESWRGGGGIKDILHTVHRVKGRPRSVVAGTAFLHGSLVPIYIYKKRERDGRRLHLSDNAQASRPSSSVPHF